MRAPLLLLLALAACRGTPSAPGDGPPGERPRELSLGFIDGRLEARIREAGSDRSPLPDLGAWPASGIVRRPIDLAGCLGQGPGSEDCHARVAIDAGRCSPKKRCDRLLVFWAGGEQGCASGLYNGILDHHAGEGFVAACAQPFASSGEAGRYPYHQELERMHALMIAIRALPEVAAIWDGSRLLISGVSHGGTAPLAAIAAGSTLRTRAAVWTGSAGTAVVLYDGISSPAALDAWAAQQSSCELWHLRIVGRYGDGSPLLHSCTNGACHCANPPHAADWLKDTVALSSLAGGPKSPYGCEALTPAAGKVLYRFVSCGNALAACNMLTGDLIPDEQQQAAHDGVMSCAGVEASYKSYPLCAHPACGTRLCGGDDTLAWLATRGF